MTVAIEVRRCAGRVFYTGVATVDVEGRGYIELRTDVCADEDHARACLVDLSRALCGNRTSELCTELEDLRTAPRRFHPSGRRTARCLTTPIGPPRDKRD